MKTLMNYKVILHLLVALMVCISPLLMNAIWADGDLSRGLYSKYLIEAFSLLTIYIVNYYLFIPKFLFCNLKLKFFLCNLVLLILLISLMCFLRESIIDKPIYIVKKVHTKYWILPISRDIFSQVLTVGFAIAVRLTGRFRDNELALKEAEGARASAELLNLRNQINPHFLLNTLNNIYALISFNSEKAQDSVQKLSVLLRYVLYENKEETVLLTKEVDFLVNYIELMKIRLSKNVEVITYFNIPKTSTTRIAPLIFISLVENAFKHGINPLEQSYIHIYIEEVDGGRGVLVRIENSNHPKQESDKSGNGIGLEQVRRRLDLLYNGMYDWDVDCDAKHYKSKLFIKME